MRSVVIFSLAGFMMAPAFPGQSVIQTKVAPIQPLKRGNLELSASEMVYDVTRQEATAMGGVRIHSIYPDCTITLTCDQANATLGDQGKLMNVMAMGNVIIQHQSTNQHTQPNTLRAGVCQYNVVTQCVACQQQVRITHQEQTLEGEDCEIDFKNGIYRIRNHSPKASPQHATTHNSKPVRMHFQLAHRTVS
jgi:lipopolysaccharide export system protein LptA